MLTAASFCTMWTCLNKKQVDRNSPGFWSSLETESLFSRWGNPLRLSAIV